MIIITAKIIFTENARKSNCVELIEFYEVFALEKFPSQREASHTLQSWRIFQSWQKFGKNREIAWQFSFSDRFFRKILVKIFPSYEVLGNFVPKSKFEVLVSIKRAKRYVKNKNQRAVFRLKPKALKESSSRIF